jgi:hypothetical protein
MQTLCGIDISGEAIIAVLVIPHASEPYDPSL